jgi:hypothetical protein
MGIPKTKSELLRAMETWRREWDTVLSQINEQSLSEPAVEGIWSVKQIVAPSYGICMLSVRIVDRVSGGRLLML